jgi:hypothetical protein
MPVWPPRDEQVDLHTSLPDRVAARIVPIVENHFLGLALRLKALESRFTRLERVVEGWKPETLKRELGQAISDSEAAVHDHLEAVETSVHDWFESLEGDLGDLADEVSKVAFLTRSLETILEGALERHLEHARVEIVRDLLAALASKPAEAPVSSPEPGPTPPEPPDAPDPVDGPGPTVPNQAIDRTAVQAWKEKNLDSGLRVLGEAGRKALEEGAASPLWRAYMVALCRTLPNQGHQEIAHGFDLLAPRIGTLQAHWKTSGLPAGDIDGCRLVDELVRRTETTLTAQPMPIQALKKLVTLLGHPRLGQTETWPTGLPRSTVKTMERWMVWTTLDTAYESFDWGPQRLALWKGYRSQVRTARLILPERSFPHMRAEMAAIGNRPASFNDTNGSGALVLVFPGLTAVALFNRQAVAYL